VKEDPVECFDMTRERIRYRRYGWRDLKAMVELDAACFSAPFRFSTDTMRRFAEARNAWVIVAEEEKESELAGFCIVHCEKTTGGEIGYVVTIDVAERWRGNGIGERMLAEGEAWVRSWKGRGMMLHVFAQNLVAVRFYERMRYRRVGVQRGFYGSGLDAVMYWKQLGAGETSMYFGSE
jgi:ribosomal-protein-alanine N-acetyltransferase